MSPLYPTTPVTKTVKKDTKRKNFTPSGRATLPRISVTRQVISSPTWSTTLTSSVQRFPREGVLVRLYLLLLVLLLDPKVPSKVAPWFLYNTCNWVIRSVAGTLPLNSHSVVLIMTVIGCLLRVYTTPTWPYETPKIQNVPGTWKPSSSVERKKGRRNEWDRMTFLYLKKNHTLLNLLYLPFIKGYVPLGEKRRKRTTFPIYKTWSRSGSGDLG